MQKNISRDWSNGKHFGLCLLPIVFPLCFHSSGFLIRIVALELRQSFFCPLFPDHEPLNDEDADNGGNYETESSWEPFAERRRFQLRKDQDGQPSRDGVLEAVHATDYQGPLLVVVGTDFVGPGVAVNGRLDESKLKARKSKSKEDIQNGSHQLYPSSQERKLLQSQAWRPESEDTGGKEAIYL